MIRRKIREVLLKRKIWAERAADETSVRQLIKRLRPLSSDIPFVRVGGSNDGGYLIPDDLDGIAACISPGVFNECSFDRDCAARGMAIHMADASVDGPPEHNPNFHFSKLFFDTYESETTTTIDGFCRYIAMGSDLLLQMDIEGAEYRVLSSASDDLMRRFRIMAIEFHALDSLYSPFGLEQISAVFDKILRTHVVVHIHPNNAHANVINGAIGIPPVAELTFLRRDRAVFNKRFLSFPHPLDGKNNHAAPDVVLPELWYA